MCNLGNNLARGSLRCRTPARRFPKEQIERICRNRKAEIWCHYVWRNGSGSLCRGSSQMQQGWATKTDMRLSNRSNSLGKRFNPCNAEYERFRTYCKNHSPKIGELVWDIEFFELVERPRFNLIRRANCPAIFQQTNPTWPTKAKKLWRQALNLKMKSRKKLTHCGKAAY